MGTIEQHEYLNKHQALYPKKPILIWHHGADPWHDFPCEHEELIWTVSILPNEFFCDWDAPEWSNAYREAIKVAAWGRKSGVEIETAFSGSKSIHQSLYFDPKSLVIPKDMIQDMAEVDGARVVRVALLEILKDEAALDTRAGCLDTAKIRFSKDTKGSMKRIYGSTKEGKPPKTWINSIPESKPENYLLVYPPELPKLFSLEPWKGKLLATLRDEIARKNAYTDEDYNIPMELSDIINRPWWAWMIRPPEGFHDIALSALVLLLKDINTSEGATIRIMEAFWAPEEKCKSPSHQPRSDSFRHRIGHLYRSPLHFSARRFQEDAKEYGMLSTMESRKEFLQGRIEKTKERGSDRYKQNRAAGIEDEAIALPFDPEKTDDLAANAEQFFAQKYNLPHKMLGGPDDGYDFRIGSKTIDVKWTPRSNGKLLSRVGHVAADYYVLIVEQFRIVGWADAKTIRSHKTNLGHGPTYAVPQNVLNPDVDSLIQGLKK